MTPSPGPGDVDRLQLATMRSGTGASSGLQVPPLLSPATSTATSVSGTAATPTSTSGPAATPTLASGAPLSSTSTPLASAALDALLVSLTTAADYQRTLTLEHRHLADSSISAAAWRRLREAAVVRLALNNNMLTGVAAELATVTTLRYLNLRSNAMRHFPVAICQLPHLEILDVSRNKITRLPSASLGNLEKTLKVLSIAKNRFRRIPAYFGSMSELRVLKVDGNPLEDPPKDIVSPGIDESADAWLARLKAYLMRQAESGVGGSTLADDGASMVTMDTMREMTPSVSSQSLAKSLRGAGGGTSRSSSQQSVALKDDASIVTDSTNSPEREPLHQFAMQHPQLMVERQVQILQRRLHDNVIIATSADVVDQKMMELLRSRTGASVTSSDAEISCSVLFAAVQLCASAKHIVDYLDNPTLQVEIRRIVDGIQRLVVQAVDGMMVSGSLSDESIVDRRATIIVILQQLARLLLLLQRECRQTVTVLDIRLGKTHCMEIYTSMLHVKEAYDALRPSPATTVTSAIGGASPSPPQPGTPSSAGGTIRAQRRAGRNAVVSRHSPAGSSSSVDSPASRIGVFIGGGASPPRPSPATSTGSSQVSASGANSSPALPASALNVIGGMSEQMANHPLRSLLVATENATGAASYLVSLLQQMLQEAVTAPASSDTTSAMAETMSSLIIASMDIVQRLTTSARNVLFHPTDLATLKRRLHSDANLFLTQTTRLITASRSMLGDPATAPKTVVGALQTLTRTTRVLAIQLQSTGVGAITSGASTSRSQSEVGSNASGNGQSTSISSSPGRRRMN